MPIKRSEQEKVHFISVSKDQTAGESYDAACCATISQNTFEAQKSQTTQHGIVWDIISSGKY